MSEALEVKSETTHFWRPERKTVLVKFLIVVMAFIALASVLTAWHFSPIAGGYEETDNAYIRGRTMLIAPQVSGYVVQVLVNDYQHVKASQVLVKIDDRIYKARVEQAKANLDAQLAQLANSEQALAAKKAALMSQKAGINNAKAQLDKARSDLDRVNELVKDGSVSIKEHDQTLAAINQAKAQLQQAIASGNIATQDIKSVNVNREFLKAQVEAARAQLKLAEIDLANTIIRSPEDGQVGEIGVRLGQYVTNGTLLLALVPYDRWLIANFKESQTAKMQLGQVVLFTVDALNDARFKGRIEQISPATGSEFSILKPDNASGNFVKVPQRIGIRIAINPDQKLIARLRPGMSTQVKIIINGSGS